MVFTEIKILMWSARPYKDSASVTPPASHSYFLHTSYTELLSLLQMHPISS